MSSLEPDATRGFRPSARRRNRIAAGVALGAAAIGGNLLVYSSLDDSISVVQAVRDIPAGTEITSDMLRTVDVDLDDSVRAVPGEQLSLVPGRYAKVRIVSGSLIVDPALQDLPLVANESAVVAIDISPSLIPIGTRERSRVELVFNDRDDATVVVPGRTVGLPVVSTSSGSTVSLSVEVEAASASAVAISDDVRVVLLSPDEDGS